jgi:hypothetical protein
MTTRHVQAEEPSHNEPAEFRQDSPEQQRLVGEHAWPLDEQVDPGSQKPEVEPSGTEQLRPEQQSALVTHRPAWG